MWVAGGKRFAGAEDLCRLAFIMPQAELEVAFRSAQLMAQSLGGTAGTRLTVPPFGTGVLHSSHQRVGTCGDNMTENGEYFGLSIRSAIEFTSFFLLLSNV